MFVASDEIQEKDQCRCSLDLGKSDSHPLRLIHNGLSLLVSNRMDEKHKFQRYPNSNSFGKHKALGARKILRLLAECNDI